MKKLSLPISVGLVSILFLLIIGSLSVGQIALPFLGVLKSILQAMRIPIGGESLNALDISILWYIRMPRVIIAVLVGAGLAMSGAIMQGILRNPLADPGIMGISAGASFGAVIAIALGFSSSYPLSVPFFALFGAVLAIVVAILITLRNGYNQNVLVLLLAGVTVSILLSAMTSGILTYVNEYRLRSFLFWMIGDLDYRQWYQVWLALPGIVVGGSILLFLGRQMNVLVLGDVEAKSMGMSVSWYRMLFLSIASLLTALSVCVSGNIGFVGLVIPHVVRLLIGPDYRKLFPLSALVGAIFLLACDTIGRIILPHEEIRVGIITALVGAPYFLFLLYRLQKRGHM